MPGTATRSPRSASVPGPQILGRLLVDGGAVSDDALADALAEQRRCGDRIGEVLVRSGATDEESVARALAKQLGLPYAPGPLDPDPEAMALVRPDLARDRLVVPLRLDGRSLRLAMADPLDLAAVDDIRFQTGRRIDPAVATPTAVRTALDGGGSSDVGTLLDLVAELPTRLPALADDADRDSLEVAARSAPVVRLVEHLLERAAEQEVSDIHLERGGGRLRVRFRTDGLLRTLTELPGESHAPVLSRLKIIAGLDIAVKRQPQDGSFGFDHEGSQLSVRLSTLPTASGEKAVLRLLDPARAPSGVERLGLAPEGVARLRRLIGAQQGVILAAGPTGSGKSSTLFGALAEVDRDTLNVVTLEDPVEYRLPGVNQIQVDPRAGLTFPAALRSVLRQDPDVVMVGEIRDGETAEIAMAAAITGHLVLSTIHTTDAPGALTRLVNMGVPPYLVAGGVSGVVAQRLVRRLCRRCLGRDPDCDRCPDGYRGRTGIFQLMVMTDALREEVVGEGSTTTLRRIALESGMTTLMDDARRKVAEGTTTPHEVARVVQEDPGAARPCARCGAGVPTSASGCPRCGNRRESRCPCGGRIRKGWRFCPWCLRKILA